MFRDLTDVNLVVRKVASFSYIVIEAQIPDMIQCQVAFNGVQLPFPLTECVDRTYMFDDKGSSL